MTEAVEWLDCWDTHYMSHLSPESYTALRKISVEHKCYDADDATNFEPRGKKLGKGEHKGMRNHGHSHEDVADESDNS